MRRILPDQFVGAQMELAERIPFISPSTVTAATSGGLLYFYY
jgi:hypothetical protein